MSEETKREEQGACPYKRGVIYVDSHGHQVVEPPPEQRPPDPTP